MHIYLSNTVIFLSIGSLTRTARPLPDMVSPVLSLYLLHLLNLNTIQRHHHHEIRKQEISTVSSNKRQVCCNITGVLLFRVTPSETEHQNPIQLDSFAVQITEDSDNTIYICSPAMKHWCQLQPTKSDWQQGLNLNQKFHINSIRHGSVNKLLAAISIMYK